MKTIQEENSSEKMLHLKQLELNSLLELTQAINNNLPEDSLYKIFHFTIRAHMHINKLSLFVHENGWANKVEYGVSETLKSIILEEENVYVHHCLCYGFVRLTLLFSSVRTGNSYSP